MDPVVHFEMPYENRDRMAKFYAEAFGWKAQMLGADMGEYVVAETTPVDPKTKRPKEPGAINGGFYKKTDDPRSHAPGLVIAVKDINEAIKKVKEAGGTIQGSMKDPNGPEEIPGVGLYCSFLDTEGNRVSILEPKGM